MSTISKVWLESHIKNEGDKTMLMNEAKFWALIEKAWQPAAAKGARTMLSNGQATERMINGLRASIPTVLEELVRLLYGLQEGELLAFDRILERNLYNLDTRELKDMLDASSDGFLYARGFIVLAGKQYYEAAKSRPEVAFPDLECEHICYLPQQVYRNRFAKEPPPSRISRETFSNPDGWPDAKAIQTLETPCATKLAGVERAVQALRNIEPEHGYGWMEFLLHYKDPDIAHLPTPQAMLFFFGLQRHFLTAASQRADKWIGPVHLDDYIQLMRNPANTNFIDGRVGSLHREDATLELAVEELVQAGLMQRMQGTRNLLLLQVGLTGTDFVKLEELDAMYISALLGDWIFAASEQVLFCEGRAQQCEKHWYDHLCACERSQDPAIQAIAQDARAYLGCGTPASLGAGPSRW